MRTVKRKPIQLILLILMLMFTPATFILMGLHLGFFNSVTLSKEQGLRIKALVIKHQGDYTRGGKYIPVVGDYLRNNYQTVCKPISIYMNDTTKVIKKMLESYHGCIVDASFDIKGVDNILLREYSWVEPYYKAHIKAHPSIAFIKASSELKKHASKSQGNLIFPILSILEPGANFLYIARYESSLK